MKTRDAAALGEIIRLCDIGAHLVARGRHWYDGDPDNVPGLAAESLIMKIGENVARLSGETTDRHPEVPWSLIKRMRDRLAHHYEGTDHGAVWDTLVVDLPTIRGLLAGVADAEGCLAGPPPARDAIDRSSLAGASSDHELT